MKSLNQRVKNIWWELRKRGIHIYRNSRFLALEKDLTVAEEPFPENDSISFYWGTAERDLDDIVQFFPDDLGFPLFCTPAPIVREEVRSRFKSGVPTFVARDTKTNMFLGVIWCPDCDFSSALPDGRDQPKSYKNTNLYIVPEARGCGVAQGLLRFAEKELRKCEYQKAYSLISPYLIASLRANMRIGYTPFGSLTFRTLFGKRSKKFDTKMDLYPGAYPIVPVVIPISTTLDRPSVLGTFRALGRKGIPVHVIAKGPTPCIKKSRFYKSFKNVEGVLSLDQWKIEFESVLERIGPTKRKPLLLFCTEFELALFAPIRDYLEERFLLVPSIDTVTPFLEKDQQAPLAEKAGFRIPKLFVLEKKAQLTECVETLRFPVVVKPLARHTEGVFHLKSVIVKTAEEFTQRISQYLDQPPTVLVIQEFIPGSDNDILVFMGSCDAEGNVRAHITGRKKRQYPPFSGIMASGYVEPIPAFEEKSRALCKQYKMRGFVGIECKRPPGTLDDVYIETSFRPESFNSLAEGAGVNLVFDTYLAALGEPCMIQRSASKGSWCDFQADLDSTRMLIQAGEMSWSDFWKKLPRPISYSFFAWDDPGPFLRWFISAAWKKLKLTLCRSY